MSSVFISYSHYDRDFVQRLASDLQHEGLDVWWDAEIEAGERFVQAIHDALGRVDYFLLVLSPHSVASEWVRHEMDVAFILTLERQMKGLIPLLIANCSIPLVVADRQRVDFRQPYDAALQELLAAFKAPPRQRGLYRMPRRVEDFVGRRRELADVLKSLRRGQSRLICGWPGVGKSALATEAAHRLLRDRTFGTRFPHGICWLTVQPKWPVQEVALELAAALGHEDIRRVPHENDRWRAVQSVLAHTQALLVLDNVQKDGQIRELLSCNTLSAWLVTCRSHLAIPGLESWHLEALDLDDAAKLFASRAHLPADDASPEAVAAICENLGRLPLALHIAAALYASQRIRPLSALRQRLAAQRQRLDELQAEDASVRAAFDLSYNDLDARLQALFASLGAFASDTWTLPAVAAVNGEWIELQSWRDQVARLLRRRWRRAMLRPADAQQIERGLDELIARSLAERRPDGYGTHPLLHEYAGEKLATRPDGEGMRQRHAAYFLRYAQERKDERDWFAIERVRAEVLAGQDWAEKAGALEMASDYGYAAFEGLYVRGFYSESRQVLHCALRAAQALEKRQDVASQLGSLGLVYAAMGDLPKAIDHHQQALAIDRQIGYRQGEASDLGNLGLVYAAMGDLRKALQHHQQALAIHREIGYRRGEASDLGNLLIHA